MESKKLLVIRLIPQGAGLYDIPSRNEQLFGKKVYWGERWENVVEFDDKDEIRSYFTSHPFSFRIVNLPEGYIRVNGVDRSGEETAILDRPDGVLLKRRGRRKGSKGKKQTPKSK